MGWTFAGLFESSLGCSVTVTEVRDLGAVEAEEAEGSSSKPWLAWMS